MIAEAADSIDSAIAAGQNALAERRSEAQIGLTTGRVVLLNVPSDLSDTELMDLVAEVATNLRKAVRPQPATARILVPR